MDAAAAALDAHALCLGAAAERLGIATGVSLFPRASGLPGAWLRLELGAGAWYFRLGVLRRASVDGGLGRHVNGRAGALTADKAATKEKLTAAGLSVPTGRLFGPHEVFGALAYAAGLGRPVCVKPNLGRKGLLVFPGCRAPSAISNAFEAVAHRFGDVVVEESLTGEAVRFFYVRPRVVGIKIGRPPSVGGDGIRTVEALVVAKNEERARRAVPGHGAIAIDGNLLDIVAAQGFSPSSVPPAGRRVLLGLLSGGSAGAESIACADGVHPSYIGQVEAACAAIRGLRVSAVDTIIAERRAPATPRNHWILELNSSPSLVAYHHPWEGAPQDVAGAILRHLLGDRGTA